MRGYVAGNGSAGYSGDGGQATNAELDAPYGIAVDASGDLFIADTWQQPHPRGQRHHARHYHRRRQRHRRLQRRRRTGHRAPNLTVPGGIAVDASGDLFIADTGNDRIREVNASTQRHYHGRRQRKGGL